MKLDVDISGGKRLFAAAALLIGLALGWYFYGQPSFRKGDVATPTIADQNSIAVLPFAHISGYFSDGMTEDKAVALALAERALAAIPLDCAFITRKTVLTAKGMSSGMAAR